MEKSVIIIFLLYTILIPSTITSNGGTINLTTIDHLETLLYVTYWYVTHWQGSWINEFCYSIQWRIGKQLDLNLIVGSLEFILMGRWIQVGTKWPAHTLAYRFHAAVRTVCKARYYGSVNEALRIYQSLGSHMSESIGKTSWHNKS